MKDGTAATFQEHTIAISRPLVHEINNALTGVLTFSKLAARKVSEMESLPRGFSELMAQLEVSAQRSAVLAKALLDFLPKAPLAWESTDLVALVEKALADPPPLRENSVRTSPAIKMDLPGEPVATQACPGLLSQALRALAANALEAALEALPERPPRIAVRLCTSEGIARILVEDSGSGVPGHLTERIFEPFFTTKAAGEHLGLGLYVARAAARLHGGDLHLESTGDAGSRFVLWFLLKEPPQRPVSWEAVRKRRG
ncbi:Histidine kinase-, DNA gyrase B-, and HSP90-like ATPase [Desulfacinum infernum DSM 9756]|uniref:histidine kinase n=1 Tax=Desulfacinum infernum DSM 9756 TaxID=1121391 RepID=A0A1M4VHC3_9BACT|nr:HAMP domain-containing sensor histidine kinase [Desulfacinum infernum]SHE68280.1 Histidine kinase-, DNA gyrase B-, and HSP90-like ATPase [Desulfacinum infernum DSM 9756]